MEIIKIKGNTFCIDTGMSYIPFYKINDEEIILLDSGWAHGERNELEHLLEKNKLAIAAIICSHSHIDHIGNNAYFKNKYKCLIAMSEFEALICSSLINLKVYYSSQTLTQVEEHYGHMVCETDLLISETQEKINIAGVRFKILHTPGHSPAHICIITPDDVAYLGDVLVSHDVMESSKLPYAFILREDIKSKEKLFDLKCRKYVVAHKGIYEDITNLITDNINFYNSKVDKILDLIDKDMTMEEIMKLTVNKLQIQIQSRYKYAVVERMLKSYVEFLHETGRLALKVEEGFLKYFSTNHPND